MILCCGESLIDMIPRPCDGGATGFVPHSGGAVFNTAIALGRLGAPAGLLTGLSTDLFGRQLAETLAASGVSTALAITSDRPTTLAFVELTEGQARYTFYDENTAGRMIAETELPALPEDVSALFFGGISLISEPAADTYAALAARGGDRAVMLDPNIRAGFVRDAERYRARLARMIALADIVKVSDEDLDWLYPGDAPLTDKLARLQAAGPSVAILTRGAKGAVALLPFGAQVEVASARATVVDTVGAGDTFNAGVLAKLSELGLLGKAALAELAEEPARDALAFGATVAAVTVARAGANPPWREEL
ncbi:carbohydrate kinase family protein [Acidimangrovimonas pyrenivorans]|uniref:Carbohydrate kinase n=1 Tax=Acidimangrovimonas pyrenivorans TaxID=2030798 RepID=A0ABV7AIH0_9RHOB